MFSKPKYYWSDVEFRGIYLGPASYIGPNPEDVLFICLNYLTGKSDNFDLYFDAEGYEFGITEIAGAFYGWEDKDGMTIITPPNFIPEINETKKDFVKSIAREVIEDITPCIDDWVNFCFPGDTHPKYKDSIPSLIEQVKIEIDKPEHQPELGNILFGHSFGNFPITDREKFESKFMELLDLGFDSYGHVVDDDLEKLYVKTKESASGPVTFLEETYTPHLHYFDNGTFMLNPYYWGDEGDLCEYPNFIYYPANLEIRWYKYPLRDSYCNIDISYDDFCKIVDECKKSLINR